MKHPSVPHLDTSARRRLLRGILSAPAVMTVTTGSAFAAASNARCLANGTAIEPNALLTLPTTDQFVRVRLYQGNGNWYVYGQQLPQEGSTFLTSAQWQQFDLTNYVLTGPVLSSKPSGVSTTSTASKFVLVRFNETGGIVGVGKKLAGNGSAIGASCWSSFNGLP